MTEPTRRLTLSEIVQQLLARGTRDGSSVTLTRNAKGDTQIEVVVRTHEDGAATPQDAATVARAVYDELCTAYKYPAATPAEPPKGKRA